MALVAVDPEDVKKERKKCCTLVSICGGMVVVSVTLRVLVTVSIVNIGAGGVLCRW